MIRGWISCGAMLGLLFAATGALAQGPDEALAKFAAEHGARVATGVFGVPGATGRPYSIEVEETLTGGPVALRLSVFDVARRGEGMTVIFAEASEDGIAGFYVLESEENVVARLLAEEARSDWLVVARVSAVQRALPGITPLPEPPYVARGELMAVSAIP